MAPKMAPSKQRPARRPGERRTTLHATARALRMAGILAREPMTRKQIAAHLQMSDRQVWQSLQVLIELRIVREDRTTPPAIWYMVAPGTTIEQISDAIDR